MIARDQYGYICQQDPGNPSYMDGGDSSRSSGMMAMAGSARDKFLLPNFEVAPGYLCRHPKQPNLNNPNNFTRDQLVQFMAGLNKTDNTPLAKRVFWTHAKRAFLAQNTHNLDGTVKPWYNGRDPLSPSNIGQLIIVARMYALYPLLILCGLWLLLEILVNSLAYSADTENNQIIALCDVYGKPFLKLYRGLCRYWESALSTYWGTDTQFRYQPEIGQKIIDYVKSK